MTDPGTTARPTMAGRPHGEALSILARSPRDSLAPLAERLLERLGAVEVIHSRTGLVMLPMTDSVRATDFHLGEVLVAEAHIRKEGAEGYALVLGRDTEHAMAAAVIDLAAALAQDEAEIAVLLDAEAALQQDADAATLRAVEATRIDMKIF